MTGRDDARVGGAGRTIVVLVGLPGSGKSTFAAQKHRPGVRVVNRDTIRGDLFGSAYARSSPDPGREFAVTRREVQQVRAALRDGHDVIVDDTNLAPAARRVWESLGQEEGALVRQVHMDASLRQVLERNSGRAHPVPDSVIRSLHQAHTDPETGLLIRVPAGGPVRVQRSRRSGWRLPAGAVVVSRPTRWGNPYSVVNDPGAGWVVRDPAGTWLAERRASKFDAQVDAVAAFTVLVDSPGAEWVKDAREHLAGRSLACWCDLGDPCHADVLLAAANDR